MSAMLLPISLASCQKDKVSDTLIEKPEIEITDGMITPEVLEAFGRISEALPSPDGKTIIFTLKYESIEQNKGNAEIYSMDATGENMTRLTKTVGSESNLRWIEDGKKIAFIRYDKDSEASQLFVMNADGSGEKKVSDVKNGINCFEISPTVPK